MKCYRVQEIFEMTCVLVWAEDRDKARWDGCRELNLDSEHYIYIKAYRVPELDGEPKKYATAKDYVTAKIWVECGNCLREVHNLQESIEFDEHERISKCIHCDPECKCDFCTIDY